MRKHLRECVALVVNVCLIGFAATVAAQVDETFQIEIGDGAAVCAEGKSASRRHLDRSAHSVASTNIDVTYYHLDLDVDLTGSTIDGVVRIEGTVKGSAMSLLVLDLAPEMIVSSVKLPDLTPLAFSHIGYTLSITLPAPVSVGGTVRVDVAYAGTPSSGGFGYFVFGNHASGRYAWSLSEPYGSRQWWPCKDHPADKADSVRVTVTVPSTYRVGSQGTLVSEISAGGFTTYDWVSNYPISSYLVSIAVGKYVRYQNSYVRPPALASLYGPLVMPLDDLVYNDTTPGRPAGWANVADALAVFEEWYGPYPFASEKYGHAEVTFGGGMEHQTMSSMGGSSVSLVSHELAHQWYGDKLSPKTWPHLWLNEGFATYSELVYWQARAATYPGVYESTLASRYNSAKSALGTLVLEDTASVNNMFNYNRVYAKGAVVLHMLRFVVGDTNFKNILSEYAADPAVRYGVAVTNDFKRVAETVSGMDLAAFFTQWVTTGTGYPTYRTSASWVPDGPGYTVYVGVEQTQTMPQSNVPVFKMPLIIAVQTTSGEERFRVDNTRRIEMFEVSVASEPTSVSIDPDAVILRSTTIATGIVDRPPAARLAIHSLVPNPARNTVSIEYDAAVPGDMTLDIFDVAGRRVHSQAMSSGGAGVRVERVDTSRLAAGIYFLRLGTPTAQATRKFAVVR